MDEYADLAKIVMGSTRGYKLGSLEFPLRVREKLKCKDFHWYMTNVYPEMYVPGNLRQQLDIATQRLQNEQSVIAQRNAQELYFNTQIKSFASRRNDASK